MIPHMTSTSEERTKSKKIKRTREGRKEDKEETLRLCGDQRILAEVGCTWNES